MKGSFALMASVALVAMLSTPSQSDDSMGFKGPGWYLIVNAFVWMIDEGPYSSQGDCQSQENAKVSAKGGKNDNDYDCVYLASESDLERVNGGN